MRSFGLDYESKLVGQCYDGAANMSGKKNGLNVQIRKLAKKTIYVPCYAHQLNLVLQHSCEDTKLARNTLCTINNLHGFIEGSAKRHDMFKKNQNPQFSTTLKYLTQTR
jgi:hypothetical protein